MALPTLPLIPSIHSALELTVLAAASKAKTTTSSSSPVSLFIFLGLMVLVIYYVTRSSRARRDTMNRQRDANSNLEVGDDVLTGAGIFGTVMEIDGDRIVLWTGAGHSVTVLRSTIAKRLAPGEYSAAPGEEPHDAEGSESADGTSGALGAAEASSNGAHPNGPGPAAPDDTEPTADEPSTGGKGDPP